MTQRLSFPRYPLSITAGDVRVRYFFRRLACCRRFYVLTCTQSRRTVSCVLEINILRYGELFREDAYTTIWRVIRHYSVKTPTCKAEFITENAIVVSGEAFVDRGAYR